MKPTPWVVGLAIATAACESHEVDLGGAADAGSASLGPTSCAIAPGEQACSPSAACNDGSGYLVTPQITCGTSSIAVETYPSIEDVTAALVGTWTSCQLGETTQFLTPDALGIEFQRGGRYAVLGADPNDSTSLVPLVSDAGVPLNLGGTFEVVPQAPTTMSPSPYSLHIVGPDGYLYTPQLEIHGSSAWLQLLFPASLYYGAALPKAYQAHICGPPLGPTAHTPTTYAEIAARLAGRWIRCANPNAPTFLDDVFLLGVEFTSAGDFYQLEADSSGNPARAIGPTTFGTYGPYGSSQTTVLITPQAGNGGPVFEPLFDDCGGMQMEIDLQDVGSSPPPSPYPGPFFRRSP